MIRKVESVEMDFLNIEYRKMYWLVGRNSQLTVVTKLPL